MLKRVEPCDSAKTAEARRARKELAVSTVEDDIGVSAKSLQLEQIRSMALRPDEDYSVPSNIPLVVHCHGPNSTTTTIEGCPLTAPVFPQATWFPENHEHSGLPVTDGTESSTDSSSQCSDAANLLLALKESKSNVTSCL